MIGDFARALLQGYVAPRASARRVLDSGQGIEAALCMVALAYLLQSMLTILFLSGAFGLVGHVMAIVQQLVTFFLFSALVYGIGRLAGGTGTMTGAQLIIGWHALVTSLISPLAIGVSVAVFGAAADGTTGVPPGVVLMAIAYLGISFWLLANYVAELHGFRNPWAVLGTIVGLSFACAMLLVTAVGTFASA